MAVAEAIKAFSSMHPAFKISQDLFAGLEAVFFEAIELSQDIRTQRAEYSFELPLPGLSFEAELMEDHEGDDGPELTPCGVTFAIFPAVIKLRDMRGVRVRLLQPEDGRR